MTLKKVYFQSLSRFFKLSHKKSLIAILYSKKSVSNFILLFFFFFSVKLSYYKNFYYKKMTEKNVWQFAGEI